MISPTSIAVEALRAAEELAKDVLGSNDSTARRRLAERVLDALDRLRKVP